MGDLQFRNVNLDFLFGSLDFQASIRSVPSSVSNVLVSNTKKIVSQINCWAHCITRNLDVLDPEDYLPVSVSLPVPPVPQGELILHLSYRSP